MKVTIQMKAIEQQWYYFIIVFKTAEVLEKYLNS